MDVKRLVHYTAGGLALSAGAYFLGRATLDTYPINLETAERNIQAGTHHWQDWGDSVAAGSALGGVLGFFCVRPKPRETDERLPRRPVLR